MFNSVLRSTKRMEFRVTVTSLPLTIYYYKVSRASQVVLVVKNPPAHAGDIETQVRFLGQADRPEKEMATHSNSCLENVSFGVVKKFLIGGEYHSSVLVKPITLLQFPMFITVTVPAEQFKIVKAAGHIRI